jgi:hypothetical protein
MLQDWWLCHKPHSQHEWEKQQVEWESVLKYTVLRTYMILSILSSLFYENTCVLLLDLLTTVCSMFMKDFLALFYLTVLLKSNRKTLLVWGGFTSVRSNAIQLDVAFSHKVITTASLKNFEYVQRLSVIQVFNYNSLTVVKDIIEAFVTENPLTYLLLTTAQWSLASTF